MLSQLFNICLLAAIGHFNPQDEKSEAKAQKLFDRAVFAYEHGRYLESVKVYKLLVRKYPDSEVAKVASKRAAPNAVLGTYPLLEHGPSSNRVDIALMGDGFTIHHQDTFNEWAADIPDVFEQQRLFNEYFSYLNFHAYHVVSDDDNVDGYGREESTALGGLTLNTPEGHVGVDAELVRAALEFLPEHDGLALVYVRVGVLGSARRGIAAIGGRSADITIHEWGHSFGDLGDEYARFTHRRENVRNRANVADHENEDELPWAHWIKARAKGVGAYQGAAGQERGAWRPTASGCVMESGEFFCAPCREALVLRIYSLVDPIESVNYPAHPLEHTAILKIDGEFEFEVQVMQPKSHNLHVSWWLFSEKQLEQELPELVTPPEPLDLRYNRPLLARGNRNDRGPLVPIELKPDAFSKIKKSGLHKYKVKAKHLEPGRYRLFCRAKDTTKLSGEKLTWVLRDDQDLLESERAWWIRSSRSITRPIP